MLAAGDVVIRAVMVQDEDENPAAAGKAAALQLQKAMGGAKLKAVLLSECFEDRANKEKLLAGVCSVLPKEIVLGSATYGSFTQAGCTDFDSVCLLGIGGPGVGVSTALVTDMGTARLVADKDQAEIRTRLHAAGKKLAGKLQRTKKDKLLVLIADAHSPKNQFLVEGVQQVLGGAFPITGGCANKNAGQTFVYYQGKPYADSAVALMLSGDFDVSLAGRQANQEQQVIATARQGAAEALKAARASRSPCWPSTARVAAASSRSTRRSWPRCSKPWAKSCPCSAATAPARWARSTRPTRSPAPSAAAPAGT